MLGEIKSVYFGSNLNLMKRFFIVLSVILTISFVILITLLVSETDFNGFKAYKAITFEFCLIVIFGGVMSIFYQQYNFNKQVWKNQSADLKKLNVELISVYNDINENRSLIKSQARKALDGKEYFKANEYNELMMKLVGVRLNLEVNKKQLKIGFEYLSNKTVLIEQLSKIDRYLRKIIEEHEYAFREHKEIPELILASSLPYLTEYTDPFLSKKRFDQILLPIWKTLDEINQSYEKHISVKMI